MERHTVSPLLFQLLFPNIHERTLGSQSSLWSERITDLYQQHNAPFGGPLTDMGGWSLGPYGKHLCLISQSSF
jgi:hypothetical protein